MVFKQQFTDYNKITWQLRISNLSLSQQNRKFSRYISILGVFWQTHTRVMMIEWLFSCEVIQRKHCQTKTGKRVTSITCFVIART
ncbi:hypothetical protein ACVBKF_09350 [Shewanella sp. 0m-11]